MEDTELEQIEAVDLSKSGFESGWLNLKKMHSSEDEWTELVKN